MKKVLILTAAAVAAVVVWAAATLPPAHLTLAATFADGTIPGVLHIHTNRSDGRGTPGEIADAAARAGLTFIVFTDHGDATRAPDPPSYRAGVLCLDGVEISTSGGHYVALDMPAAPYPLGGEARDVVEDVKRLGGFGIAAHPDSPKPELLWREWTAPFDALEIVNPDTSWRQWRQAPGWRPKLRLFDALVDYPMRPAETIANLIQTSQTVYQWEALARRRRVGMLAGADAHANLTLRSADPIDARLSVPLPSYEASLRTLSVHVRVDRALSKDAAADAALVLRALRAGHAYTAIDGFASPAAFELTATDARGTVREGDEIGVGGPVTLHVRSNAPPDFTTVILNGTKPVASDHHEQDFSVQLPEGPAVYRAEIWPAGPRRAPWIISNAVYVRAPQAPGTKLPTRPPATTSSAMFDGKTLNGWGVESDPASHGAAELSRGAGSAELQLQYTLASSAATTPYVALRYDTHQGVAPDGRVTFAIRAEHPMRISVQLRTTANDRWQRSAYVDAFDQERTVYFDDLTPIGPSASWRPPYPDIRNVMFVIDGTNTKPGSSGRLWIKGAALQR